MGQVWSIKEALCNLWSYNYHDAVYKFWRKWYFWAIHSRLRPIYEAACMIKRHIKNILTYYKHRITNVVAEGLSSKVKAQTIKQTACGFCNSDNFKTVIYFHCRGLDFYPL